MQPVVEDKITVEPRIFQLHLEFVVALFELRHDGSRFKSRCTHIGHRVGGLQLEVDRKGVFDLGVGKPETRAHVIRGTVLEGVKIATDPRIDLERLIIDVTDARLIVGTHWRNGEVERVKCVLFCKPRIVAFVPLFLVDLRCLLLFQDLAMDLFFTRVDGHF